MYAARHTQYSSLNDALGSRTPANDPSATQAATSVPQPDPRHYYPPHPPSIPAYEYSYPPGAAPSSYDVPPVPAPAQYATLPPMRKQGSSPGNSHYHHTHPHAHTHGYATPYAPPHPPYHWSTGSEGGTGGGGSGGTGGWLSTVPQSFASDPAVPPPSVTPAPPMAAAPPSQMHTQQDQTRTYAVPAPYSSPPPPPLSSSIVPVASSAQPAVTLTKGKTRDRAAHISSVGNGQQRPLVSTLALPYTDYPKLAETYNKLLSTCAQISRPSGGALLGSSGSATAPPLDEIEQMLRTAVLGLSMFKPAEYASQVPAATGSAATTAGGSPSDAFASMPSFEPVTGRSRERTQALPRGPSEESSVMSVDIAIDSGNQLQQQTRSSPSPRATTSTPGTRGPALAPSGAATATSQPPSKRHGEGCSRASGSDGQTCLGCGATSTPEWRRGPLGPRTLCNACGLVYAKMIKKRTQDGGGGAGSNPMTTPIRPSGGGQKRDEAMIAGEQRHQESRRAAFRSLAVSDALSDDDHPYGSHDSY